MSSAAVSLLCSSESKYLNQNETGPSRAVAKAKCTQEFGWNDVLCMV